MKQKVDNEYFTIRRIALKQTKIEVL